MSKYQPAGNGNSQSSPEFDVIVVGAGFAGLYMLHSLRKLGISVQGLERGKGVGGTWYWNRYPGCRCDVESLEYSYQFSDDLQQEWEWAERYSSQPEILGYANHVADRFKLRELIQFASTVSNATYDSDNHYWRVEVNNKTYLTGRFLVMATGCLSNANQPAFPGLKEFNGQSYHTGAWPHEGVDFTGRQVGIIGTGSSAIQSIPLIAQQAEHLTVFQRTPNYSVPARNDELDPERVRSIKASYGDFRALNELQPAALGGTYPHNSESALEVSPEERQRRFEEHWKLGGFMFMGAFSDLLTNMDANGHVAEFIRSKIRSAVKDPETAELLCPSSVVGCKRLCVDTGYYETYNRSNASLVDISEHPIERLTPDGLMTNGQRYSFDDIVFATGFDAMTGSLFMANIIGEGGEPLVDKWQAGPRTYLGVMTTGFPNLFMITGPGSPSVLTNMMVSIQQHVEFIARLLSRLQDQGMTEIRAEQEAEDNWVQVVNLRADGTLFPNCNSWYLGANIPGKPRVFMPYIGFPEYTQRLNEIESSDYTGFSTA